MKRAVIAFCLVFAAKAQQCGLRPVSPPPVQPGLINPVQQCACDTSGCKWVWVNGKVETVTVNPIDPALFEHIATNGQGVAAQNADMSYRQGQAIGLAIQKWRQERKVAKRAQQANLCENGNQKACDWLSKHPN